MARQSKWKQFGDAFNAVYNAGTTLGSAIETGGIAFKDYEDEEGNKLTGLALDRARTDDYADVERKWGDPMEALRMRVGVETLGQGRLQTDYLGDTYDERVYQGGIGGTKELNANIDNTISRTGLNTANRDKINLDTEIRAGSKYSEILSNAETFDANSAKMSALGESYRNPAYLSSLTSGYKKDDAKNTADAIRFGSAEYASYLQNNDLADSSEAKERFVKSKINLSVIEDPEYQENFKADQLIKMKRTLRLTEIENIIAQDPKTLKIAKNQLDTDLNNAQVALANSKVLSDINTDPGVMKNQVKTGLLNSQTGLTTAETENLNAKELNLAAQRSLAVNAYISEWTKSADSNDATSMYRLIAGLETIDPVYAMQLKKDYGEHELWEIVNNSLLMKAKLSEAMATNGARGAREILDELNGEKFGVQIRETEGGGFEMVETQTQGYGPGQTITDVVRTIAKGDDETKFIQDLTAASDPASLLEYSKSIADMNYKEALTLFSKAQAKAAGVRKPITMDQWAASIIQDKNAPASDYSAALAYMLKDNPEAFALVMNQRNIETITDGVNSKIPPKVGGEVTVDMDAPKTENEALSAEAVVKNLTSNNLGVNDLKSYLNNNKNLLLKYGQSDVYLSEMNKLDAAKDFLDTPTGVPLTAEALEEHINALRVTAEPTLEELEAKSKKLTTGGLFPKSSYNKMKKAKEEAEAMLEAFTSDPAGVLSIVINSLEAGYNKPSTQKLRVTEKDRLEHAQKLRELISSLTQDR